MSRKPLPAQYFQIGLFMLVALGLMCSITFLMGFERLFAYPEMYHTFYEQIPRSLKRSCLVYYNGLEIGRVKAMSRVAGTNGGEWIEIVMAVNDNGLDLSTKRVRLEQPIIGGPACMLIYTPEPGETNAPVDVPLDPGRKYIAARQNTRIEVLEKSILALLTTLNTDIPNLNRGMYTVIGQLTQSLNMVNYRLNDPTITDLLGSLNTLMADSAKFMSNVVRQVDVQPMVETMASMRTTVSNLAVITTTIESSLTSNRLDRIARNVDRTFAAGAPTLQDVHDLTMELRALAAALASCAENVERNPSSLVFGKSADKPDKPGETK